MKPCCIYTLFRWRNEERAQHIAENAINNAVEQDEDDETQPLLAPSQQQDRPMSPTSRSPRQVVGYIASPTTRAETSNRTDYGTSLVRQLESPTLYNTQQCGVVPSPSPRRFWQPRQEEPIQQSSSAERRDPFLPPPGHPSQN